MKVYLEENVTQQKWSFLLRWVRDKAYFFIVSMKPDIAKVGFLKKSKVYPKALKEIKKSLTDEYDSRVRWHAKQLFSFHFYRYKCFHIPWKRRIGAISKEWI